MVRNHLLLLKALPGQAERSIINRLFQGRRRCLLRGGRDIGAEQAARRGAGRDLGAKSDAGRGRGARVVRALLCLGRTTMDASLAQDPGPGQDLDPEGEGGMILTGVEKDRAVLMVELSLLSSPEGLLRHPGGSWGAAIRGTR